ncbi:alpha/beta hydrolase family protein [Singulisphaera sp. PoT]|uniref:alpha/beta hydrolase family protein n=1 Tax=Singulisphaera sp. PoT TaxID=3411797 RepID=UPI003BF60695
MRIPVLLAFLTLTLTLTLCGAVDAQAQEPASQPKEEAWEGRLDLGGGISLRLVVHLTPSKDGALTATFDSPEQGAVGIKVDSPKRDKTTLSFEIPKIGAKFAGKLNAEEDEAVGEFMQAGKSFPLTLKLVPPGPVEFWEGKLAVRAGLELRLVLRVTKDPKDKTSRASFSSPDQTPAEFGADTFTLDKDVLSFTVRKIGGSFTGKLNATATEATGEWKQGGAAFPLSLTRKDKLTEVNHPQTPKPPFPYAEEEVEYRNEEAKIKLAGTLTTPEGPGPFPAVILISGSGAQDRDESLLGHKPFLVLADYLTRRGVAVLRVDDRGVGGSTGSTITSTSEDFGKDVLAGVAFLKSQPKIDGRKIGLIGHSEGGLIAPMVAVKSDDIAFIVLMAGTGLPGDEILALQAKLIGKAMGAKDEQLSQSLDLQKKLMAVAKAEKDDKAATKRMKELIEETIKALPEDERKELAKMKSQGDAELAVLRTPWFRYFLSFDPRPTLAKVRCPVLAIVGEKDLQVPPKENLAEIEKALKSSGNSRVVLKELPGLNHLFQTCRTGAPSEYASIEETIAPAALEIIGDWIRDQAKGGPAS